MPQDDRALERRATLAWNLFTELRKELLESQKLRAQIIGIKVTFVSTAFAVIAANLDKVYNSLLVIPAFAAISFDFLINSYSFSIRRIGWYCEHYLEPILRAGHDIPDGTLLWEEFLSQPKTKQFLAMVGNLGITILAFTAGAFAVVRPFRPGLSVTLLLTLVSLLVLDAWSYWFSKRGKFPPPAGAEGSNLAKQKGSTSNPAR
ncbi:MAG: hypothetical protein JF614_19500 [Acidobacteria bacterium]|jgi:hypothetical protein|nr:hypothetical protein [Acidobacteriota bacterium]